MRETSLQVEVALVNINVSLKRVVSTQFSELLLYLQFLKNDQRKLILMPNTHILGWHI